MSFSAVTPGALSITTATGSSRGNSLEPSPASTYSSSLNSDAGDEAPPTPNDEGVLLTNLGKLTVQDGLNPVSVYSPPFIRNSSHSHADDPFVSVSRGSGQRTPTGPKHGSRASKSDNWRTGSSSGSISEPISSPSSPSAAQATRRVEEGMGIYLQEFATKTGDFQTTDTNNITAQDAQAVYPPSSCVFVANLLQSESDEALEVAVLEVFREYGTVFVKIRRDAKHMPFAFCQYTNDRSAELACKEGRGRLICGRPCRCEKAKAHRLFFFERKYGAAITPVEVEHLLQGFGKINLCRPTTEVEMATCNIGQGVMVQFELFDNGRVAANAFKKSEDYNMASLTGLGCPRPDHTKSDPARRAYLDTYELDRRSVFIGNLPSDSTDTELKHMFSKFGEVVRVVVHKNESVVDPSAKHCFAFLEFETHSDVQEAIPEMNGAMLRGKTLRVVQKDSENARARSRRQSNRQQSPVDLGAFQSPVQQRSSIGHTTPQSLPAQSPFAGMNYNYADAGYANVCVDNNGRFWTTSPYSFPGSTFPVPQVAQYPISPYQGTQQYQGSPFQASPFTAGGPQGSLYGPPVYQYGGYPGTPSVSTPPFNWQQPTPFVYGASTGSVATAQQQTTGFSPVYSSPTGLPDDRSNTPTRTGHGVAESSSLGSH